MQMSMEEALGIVSAPLTTRLRSPLQTLAIRFSAVLSLYTIMSGKCIYGVVITLLPTRWQSLNVE